LQWKKIKDKILMSMKNYSNNLVKYYSINKTNNK
jgi:hypothetical protein